jgi:RHH-type transcriptional regulator, rel operon repressor / antitoxin RelB
LGVETIGKAETEPRFAAAGTLLHTILVLGYEAELGACMVSTAAPTTTITVRVPKAMREQLDTLAQDTGRQPSDLAYEALRTYLEFETRQVTQIQAGIRAADAGDFATDEEMAELWKELGVEPAARQGHATG